jgi:hypothetical protein
MEVIATWTLSHSAAQVTLVGINSLPEIILMDFHWEQVHKPECVNKMFTSPSVWVIPTDTPVKWQKRINKSTPDRKVCYVFHLYFLI